MEKLLNKSFRPKKFMSIESLWFEEERLATFIEWPVRHISSDDLAAEGFYYLRTKDHCACAFCRGIIGAWEVGDTPRGEHKRHFPHCPIVQGKVTGNVPLVLGKILHKIPRETCQQDIKATTPYEDVCGTGKEKTNGQILCKNGELSLQQFGLKEYCGPKRKDYLTVESRLKSFKLWPERVNQKPEELAEAGFYYCGLSDHVRCFHCGNGLRNWEYDDNPWIEHARWYQDCNYILLTKGKEFIDTVQRENPPFVPTFQSESIPPKNGNASSSTTSCSCLLTEEEIDQLMQLHIIREVISMGFPTKSVRMALMKKLTQTGLPFFSLDLAIEGVLTVLDEEKQNTIIGCEYITSQAKKMSSCRVFRPLSTRDQPLNMEVGNSEGADVTFSTAPLHSRLNNDSPPLRSSTPSSHIENNIVDPAEEDQPPLQRNYSSDSGRSSGSETEDPESQSLAVNPSEHVSSIGILVLEEETGASTTQDDPLTIRVLTVSTVQTVPVEQSVERSGDDFIMEADEVIEEAAKLLAPPSSSPSNLSSSQSSQNSDSSNDSGLCKKELNVSLPVPLKNIVNDCNSPMSEEAESLAQELEKLKENRTCRVCMDKEMDIVFLPCTHMVTCSSCAVALSSCPICRSNIQYAFKPIIT